MGNSLEKKLRKTVRKKQKRNFWLRDKNKYELVWELSCGELRQLAQDLMRDEFYELKCIFEELGEVEVLLSIIPSSCCFSRCCYDLRLFDSFSDKQLETILDDNCLSISSLFFATGINRNRQYRIIKLLHVDILNDWINNKLTTEQLSEVNRFFIWLHDKVKDTENVYEQNEETEMFRKFASISDLAICYLLENTEAFVVKEIVKQLNQMGRNVWKIYEEIFAEHLYDVLVKSDFTILDNVSEKEYFWLYSNLPAEDVERFLLYLASEKRDEFKFFNSKICCEIYGILL